MMRPLIVAEVGNALAGELPALKAEFQAIVLSAELDVTISAVNAVLRSLAAMALQILRLASLLRRDLRQPFRIAALVGAHNRAGAAIQPTITIVSKRHDSCSPLCWQIQYLSDQPESRLIAVGEELLYDYPALGEDGQLHMVLLQHADAFIHPLHCKAVPFHPFGDLLHVQHQSGFGKNLIIAVPLYMAEVERAEHDVLALIFCFYLHARTPLNLMTASISALTSSWVL